MVRIELPHVVWQRDSLPYLNGTELYIFILFITLTFFVNITTAIHDNNKHNIYHREKNSKIQRFKTRSKSNQFICLELKFTTNENIKAQIKLARR